MKKRFPLHNSQKINGHYWLVFAILLICIFFLHAKPVPFGNEFPYLLRLAKEFQPEFLVNDWTFAAPANEHWLFNRIFGYLASLVRIETIGWLGRIITWVLLLRGLFRLGRIWDISYTAIAISILFWLAIGQSMVGDEWLIGSFEAKSVSYIFLLSALFNFSKQKIIFPSVMLGIAFAFHPAVGLWSSLAVGLALFFEKIGFKKFLTITFIVSLLASLGVFPLFFDQFRGQEEIGELWQFMVTVVFPFHFDPFDFSRSYTVLLLSMLVVNCVAFHKTENFGMRFLLKFQVALGIFFLSAFLMRWLEMYELLRFLPVRLFPVFTPLFFSFTIYWGFKNFKQRKLKIAIILFAVFCIFWLNPFSSASKKVGKTLALWQSSPDDLQLTSCWIAENTPNGTIVIQPPHRRELWYWSQRAHIVSYAYPTFGRLVEWRERVNELTKNVEIKNRENTVEIIENAYNSLSADEIERIRIKYQADYLTSRNNYPFPIVFQTATYKVYKLPKK